MSTRTELPDREPDQASELTLQELFYRVARNRHRAHSAILRLFTEVSNKTGLKKADFAKLIRKDPAYINRVFSMKSNLTLDTIGVLLAGLGYEMEYRPVAIGTWAGQGVEWKGLSRPEIPASAMTSTTTSDSPSTISASAIAWTRRTA